MAPPTTTTTTTTTTNKPGRRGPRVRAKPRFKQFARALLQQRQFFRVVGQRAIDLNDDLLVSNANLLAENARLQTRPEFAFTFAAGSGQSAAAAEEAVEPLTSEQLDFDWDAWIDPAAFEADSQHLEQFFAGETMPSTPPTTTGERSSREQMMTDDGAAVSRYLEEIADLTTRLETCQTQLASYEEQAQEYQETARANESLRQDVQQEKAQRLQVESTFEHFQLQYRNERSNLASIVTPGFDFPDHQSVHEPVGQAIEQLRRDITALSTNRNDLVVQLSTAKTQFDEQSHRIHNLQQQNEAIQTQLDANIAKFQDSLTVTEAQQAVSDAVGNLSAQCEQAQHETEALREENANQKEELENLRRFREQYSSPSSRTHRRHPSSRPGSMVLAGTNLEDEISSAAVSGDDAEDSISLLQPPPQSLALSDLMTVEVAPTNLPQPQPLALSDLMTVELTPRSPPQPQSQSLALSNLMTVDLAPTSPPQIRLGLSAIMTQELEPKIPQRTALGFSAIMTQDLEPTNFQQPRNLQQPQTGSPPLLTRSTIMTQELTPRTPTRPVLSFAPISTQEVQPQTPSAQVLSFSALSQQSTAPPRRKRPFPLKKPRVYSGLPPEIQEIYDKAAKRLYLSPITTIYEQAPIPRATRVITSTTTTKITASDAAQEDVPSTRPHMSTTATAISMILALLFMLLVRLCVTRFTFFNAMRTANTITDWSATESGYSIVSYALPYRPSLGIAIHDTVWGLTSLLFNAFGAGDKASLMHYRIATWWGGPYGISFFDYALRCLTLDA